jgi:hypothetical protein
VVVATFIVFGGYVVRWLTQGAADNRWLIFALFAAAIGVAAFAWPERKQ